MSSLVSDVDRGVMMVNSRLRQAPGYTSAEVWFRAATIAVPICGALILLVLIALAVRILQSDAMDDRVLAAKLRLVDTRRDSILRWATLKFYEGSP